LRLELPWIENELGPEVEQAFGRKLTEDDVVRMRSMDDPTIIPDIYALAKIAAAKQVKPEHLAWRIAHLVRRHAAIREHAAPVARQPQAARATRRSERGREPVAREACAAAESRAALRRRVTGPLLRRLNRPLAIDRDPLGLFLEGLGAKFEVECTHLRRRPGVDPLGKEARVRVRTTCACDHIGGPAP